MEKILTELAGAGKGHLTRDTVHEATRLVHGRVLLVDLRIAEGLLAVVKLAHITQFHLMLSCHVIIELCRKKNNSIDIRYLNNRDFT